MTSLPLDSPSRPARDTAAVVLTLALPLLIPVLWDASGLDMALALRAGDVGGFPWREHWVLTTVFHQGGRALCWAVALWLCVGAEWPTGPLRRIAASRRRQLAVSVLACAAVVALLKSGSGTSCPWDLQAFGGVVQHLPHWRLGGGSDGGPGHCFPAGHAASGFAFVAGYFAFRRECPRVARVWLGAALVAGLSMGFAQQLRGAHFMSHTLWTVWICWAVSAAVDAVWPAGSGA